MSCDGSRLAAAEERAEKAERALQSLTPGGSEFVNDPENCARFVRERRDGQHAQIVRLTVAKRAAEAEAARLRMALGWLEDEGQGYRIRDHACERCVPDGGALVQGFLCGRHAFDAALQKLAVQP